MTDIASRSRGATTGLVYNLHHIADQCYTRSERSIASLATIRRHLLHMGHHLYLWCHPLQFVCSPFEVEGESIDEVVVKMVGKVLVEIVREVVIHPSRHFLLPYPPYLPITRYFYTPTDLHITFHTLRHLHIFIIFTFQSQPP